ncbi:MAG: hypothetical protein E7271_07525 [Lachnospiraceae bacterium]|nr:hypothetical protein [Lachnospiraceae bacterium]
METIAEKSRTKEIIDRLQGIMDAASPVPLASGKVMIYKDEVQSLLTELTTQINMEIKTYHEVNDKRGKILNEAKREAEKIIYQAEHSASRMRVNRRTTNVDPVNFEMMEQEELDALDSANEIYGASLIYTDEMLTEVSNLIKDTVDNLKNDYDIILQVMEEKLNTLAANRQELMAGLSEMDGKDRSQQIMEIGQLLSAELYNARMNKRSNSEVYDDGSVQLSFDLKTEHEMRALEAEEVARHAEAELERMTAQRDALMEELAKLQQEKIEEAATQKTEAEEEIKQENLRKLEADREAEAQRRKKLSKYVSDKETEVFDEAAATEDEEEYEVVYVDEDELEEGEEYEVEYVDDDEYEEAEADDAVEYVEKNSIKDEELGSVPMIPHFTKSEKIATVPSEKVVKMANKITTDKKYSGLISRAVKDNDEPAVKAKDTKKEEKTVEFEEFDITEF